MNKKPDAPRSDFLTIQEAADYLHVTVRWMRRAREERRIRAFKFGNHLRFRRSDLETFAKVNSEEAEW